MFVIDTADNVLSHIDLLRSKAIRAVARYYSTRPNKRLTRIEAAAIAAAGLDIVAVFEDDGRPELSIEQGLNDAQLALLQARAVGQPIGSAIYFALEGPPGGYSEADLEGIGLYFEGLRQVLAGNYKLGVYGNGMVCDALLSSGRCDYVWLGVAMGASGSRAFFDSGKWALAQREADLDWEGLSVDLNVAKDDVGAFRVSAVTRSVTAPMPAVHWADGPAAAAAAPGGYEPPASSLSQVAGVPFDQAVAVGTKFTDRFSVWDRTPKGRVDPSRCKGLYRLPGGALFWELKMAIDADGSPTSSVLASSSGSNQHTSFEFSHPAGAINSEVVPYFVLPKGDFVDEFGITLGTLGIIIFEDKITGAIFADEGPTDKIGEASIRVHELVRGASAPWKGNPAKKIIRDVSVEQGVLYFVFPNARLNVNDFGPRRQKAMADAIHAAAMAEFDRLKAGAHAVAPQDVAIKEADITSTGARLRTLSPRASISLQLMSEAAAPERVPANLGLVTTMARSPRSASTPVERYVSVLVETNDSIADLLEASGARDFEQLSPTIASVALPISKASLLFGDERVQYVETVKEKYSLLDRALLDVGIVGAAQRRAVDETGDNVAVGIVDTGFDLSHPAFQSNGALRVDALWDQTTNERIVGAAELQARWAPGGDRPGADGQGHGTHVASIAGGSPFSGFSGVAPSARFVLVKTDFRRIGNGVKWCFDNSGGKPCVVNLSLGGHYGAHDGQGIEERLLDQLGGPGRIIVAAAGNEREDNIHIGGVFTPQHTEMAVFDVAQNAQPQAVLTLWYDVQDDFDIVLVSPTGVEMLAPAVGTSDSRLSDGAAIQIARNLSNQNTSVQTQIVLQFSALAAFDGSLSGWGLRILCRQATVGRIDGWLAGERLAAFRAGRLIETTRTIGMPATANGVIAVASYATKNTWTSDRGPEIAPKAMLGRSSRFSSQGPTRDGREKPEISAPGEMITAALAAGSAMATDKERASHAMQTLTIEGTSMATPIVTGAVALLLQRSPGLTPADVLHILREGAMRDMYTLKLGWSPAYGYGKLSVENAMRAV